METENHETQVAARQTQHSGSGNGSASLDDAITLMSSCFALVRPTGMNDQAAEDWLSVASAELTGYPLSLVKIGCDAARRECTHHSQIVPFVLKKIGEMRPWSTLDELRALPSQKAERLEYEPEVQALIAHATKGLKGG